MSNVDNMTEIMSENQDFFIELNDQSAETISGGSPARIIPVGAEVFTIQNKTKYNVGYSVDGKSWSHAPNEGWIWTAYKGGTIKFDQDGRSGVKDYKKYNLSNGGVYEFQYNTSTPGNPWDIELYRVA